MTEFMGKIMLENIGYQGVALITSPKWRKQMVINGIQHRQSVMIIAVTLACSFLFLILSCSFRIALEDATVLIWIIIYDIVMTIKLIRYTAR